MLFVLVAIHSLDWGNSVAETAVPYRVRLSEEPLLQTPQTLVEGAHVLRHARLP